VVPRNFYETWIFLKFRIVFWDVLPCKIIVDDSSLMMEAESSSETSVDNYFTRQYIPENNSELHTRRRENLKSHIGYFCMFYSYIYRLSIKSNEYKVMFKKVDNILKENAF
jgi:hypothetical protein